MSNRNIMLIVACISLATLYPIYSFKYYGSVQKPTQSIHQCIYSNNPKYLKLTSFKTDFEVNYIEHATNNCINPHYPAIHITANGSYNAWVQIIFLKDRFSRTNRRFIDSDKFNPPIYTLNKDFYDAPLWSLPTFKLWQAHTYAVTFLNGKIIKCIGGIEWGFVFGSTPRMLPIKSLKQKDWEQDLVILQS